MTFYNSFVFTHTVEWRTWNNNFENKGSSDLATRLCAIGNCYVNLSQMIQSEFESYTRLIDRSLRLRARLLVMAFVSTNDPEAQVCSQDEKGDFFISKDGLLD